MTQRKPPGVTFEGFADAQIRRAREEGAFDDLPGKGKPLKRKGEIYDPAWWVKEFVVREGVSVLPPSLAIRRTVERELEEIAGFRHERKVRMAIEALNDEIRLANRSGIKGPPSTQPVLDIDEIVARWRAARADVEGHKLS